MLYKTKILFCFSFYNLHFTYIIMGLYINTELSMSHMIPPRSSCCDLQKMAVTCCPTKHSSRFQRLASIPSCDDAATFLKKFPITGHLRYFQFRSIFEPHPRHWSFLFIFLCHFCAQDLLFPELSLTMYPALGLLKDKNQPRGTKSSQR